MPQNTFFLWTRDLLVSQKTMQSPFFSTLHPLSTVIFVTATILAFVLLRNSRFNFHCYTQREATPTQKSARKCAATCRDFLRKRLQSAFTLANQLRWIAQKKEMIPTNVTRDMHAYDRRMKITNKRREMIYLRKKGDNTHVWSELIPTLTSISMEGHITSWEMIPCVRKNYIERMERRGGVYIRMR